MGTASWCNKNWQKKMAANMKMVVQVLIISARWCTSSWYID